MGKTDPLWRLYSPGRHLFSFSLSLPFTIVRNILKLGGHLIHSLVLWNSHTIFMLALKRGNEWIISLVLLCTLTYFLFRVSENKKPYFGTKNWWLRTVVLEKASGSPLDSKESKPVNPKGDQPWIFIGRIWCWSWSSKTWPTWCEEPNHWKRPWCWERLKAKGTWGGRGCEMVR